MAHNLIRLDYLDADAQTLSTALREQVWKAFLRFNLPGVDEEETPIPRWATKPADDLQVNATIFSTVMTALSTGAKAGYLADTDWVEENFSIPLTVGTPVNEKGGGDDPVEAPGEAPPKAKPQSTTPAAKASALRALDGD